MQFSVNEKINKVVDEMIFLVTCRGVIMVFDGYGQPWTTEPNYMVSDHFIPALHD